VKNVSFRDLQLATVLAGLNEIQMTYPENDDKMRWVLAQCGIDVEYDIEYVPCLHRDLRGKVAVGFMACGELNINRNVLNSPVCDVTDRLVAAAYQDPSLAKELATMLSSKADYRGLTDIESESDLEDEEEDNRGKEADKEYEDYSNFISEQIRQLELIRDEIRGKK